MKALVFFFTLTLGFASVGICGSLFAPFSMETAAVLPKGVRSFRLIGFTSEVTGQYGDLGQSQVLGGDFNRSVSWGELMHATAAGPTRGRLVGALQAMGVNMDAPVGDARGVLDARITATIPTLAIGVTDRLTVGLAVPVLYSNVHESFGWGTNADAQRTFTTLSHNGYGNTLLGYKAQLNNIIATKLAIDGYEPLTDQQRTGIGDVTLLAKYQAYKQGELTVAVAPKLIIPTGRQADVNKLVDLAEGSGYWSVGVASVADYQIHRFTLSANAGYVVPLPTYLAKRVPESEDDSITPDVDNDVREKRGDYLSTGLSARYQLDPQWNVGTGYIFQYKMADSYKGREFPVERYQYMSYETEQNMQAAQVGVTYSTVPYYRAHKFDVPMDLSLNFTGVLAGRNVTKSDLTEVEIAAYF